MCTCGVASKDGAKVQGWQRTDSGIIGIRGDKGGYGVIKEDMRDGLGWVEWSKKRGKVV